jgi:hypothetical protein
MAPLDSQSEIDDAVVGLGSRSGAGNGPGFVADGLAVEGSAPPPERVVIESSASAVVSVGDGNPAIEIVLLPMPGLSPRPPRFRHGLRRRRLDRGHPAAEPADRHPGE